MRKINKEEKPEFGQKVNVLKSELSALIDQKKIELEEKETLEKIESEKIDITLPSKKNKRGLKCIEE